MSIKLLAIFEIGSLSLYAQAGLDCNPVYASHTGRMTDACHHVQLTLVKMGSLGIVD
jgi:hypothetical protein